MVLLISFLIRAGFEFTGGYGATVASKKRAASTDTASTGDFSVITYNIAGLPEIISSAKTQRSSSIAEIGKRLNQYDIVHVQEDFNYNEFLYNNGNKHPYRTHTKGIVPFGDGLNTLSKYPLLEMRRIRWESCTGADCLMPKGFSYSRIEMAKNMFIDFYNVHANAYNHLSAAKARRKNIQQLSDYIKKHSEGQAVIVMGDLNAHYSYYYDNIKQLLAENNLNDTWVYLNCQGNLPVAAKRLPDNNILNLTNITETIRYCIAAAIRYS